MPRALHIFLPLGRYLWLQALHPQKEQFPEKNQEHPYTHVMEESIQFKKLTTNLKKKIQKLNTHLCEMSDTISITLHLSSFITSLSKKKKKNTNSKFLDCTEILC